MDVDTDAPAVARARAEIAAPRELVWDVITGIADWPGWNPDVRSASIEGPLAEGTRFRWKAGPGTITSTIRQVEPPRAIAWTGETMGIKAVHVYRLEQQGESTVVASEESWDGLLVRVLRRSMTKSLQKALDSGLAHLAAEAARRAGT